MKITKERLQILLDNPFDERILNHERSAILNLALEANELKAENARLREALERASEFANKDDVHGQAGDIAREALKGGK